MDQLSSLVAQQYAANRTATAPNADGEAASYLSSAASEFLSTLQASETASMQAMSGDTDPHTLVQALSQAELAVETVVTVRDKVVEAYQEILRMPV